MRGEAHKTATMVLKAARGDGAMLAVGLMSGTSLDAIDAALIETDGRDFVRPIAFRGRDYDDHERRKLVDATRDALSLAVPEPTLLIEEATRMLTVAHIDVVCALLDDAGVALAGIDVIGFHGQTVAHRPARGWTWQIGDGQAMADALGVVVVSDFRRADVAAGGQGAPLLPVYHAALASALDKPVAVLNLGGVGNITFIGADDELIAFDTGPANGLIDDWMMAATGARFDTDGAVAASGRVDPAVLGAMLGHPFFDAAPPKSLDRADFTIQPARGLSTANGAATLTAFTAQAVAEGLALLPERPRRLIVAGGGRHNPTMLAMIAERCGMTAEPCDALGWNGDGVEAQGFAYMAARALAGLPISFPGTTGVSEAMTGGIVSRPR